MKLSNTIVIFITFLIAENTKIGKNIRKIKINWIIISVIIFFMVVFL